MKYSILSFAATAVIALGAASASAQLLYSFETGDSPNAKDGFVPNGLIPSQGITGATVGTGALKLTTPSGGYTASYTQGDLPAALSDPDLTGFTFDLTISANDPPTTSGYSLVGMGLYIFNGGEGEYGDQYIAPEASWANLNLNPGTYTGLYVPLSGNNPDTSLPISYSDLLADGWAVGGFNIVDQNAGAAQTFYIDNIQAVVPEPASISLLGAVGVMALGRRRKI